MKQKVFTLLLLSAIAITSCRKDKIEQNIKQFDEAQIQSYISANGITGMIRDTSGGDTTGIYYKLILPGVIVPPATSLVPFKYSDKISYVYTLRSVDGKYVSADTIANHFEDYLGHLSNDNLPVGLQSALHNVLKYPGASIRLLIPSHLAYGVNGNGSGSITNTSTRIAGNQSLDYYVHSIADYTTYDDQVINNFLTANSLTGYQKKESVAYPGHFYYYKVLTPGTGTTPITINSSVTCTYTGQLLNGTIFDGAANGTNTATLTESTLTNGVAEGLQNFAVTGTKISFFIPSYLGYGQIPNASLPINSILRFTFQVVSTTP